MNIKQINFENLQKNLEIFKSKKLCAMVKANAYGHTLDKIADFLKDKVEFLGVCSLDEAISLRRHFDGKILITTPNADLNICKEQDFSFVVENLDILEKCKHLNILKNVHIKIDVGMNRFGFACSDFSDLKKVKELCQNEMIGGLCTHFPHLSNKKITKKQYKNFIQVKDFLKISGTVHFGGSEVINYDFEYDMIRAGIGVFYQKNSQVMQIQARINKISEMQNTFLGYNSSFKITKKKKIATLSVGYADGFFKSFSGVCVEINKKKCFVVGDVCMDCCFVDVSSVKCKVGDFANILLDIEKISAKCGVSKYEILTGFNRLR